MVDCHLLLLALLDISGQTLYCCRGGVFSYGRFFTQVYPVPGRTSGRAIYLLDLIYNQHPNPGLYNQRPVPAIQGQDLRHHLCHSPVPDLFSSYNALFLFPVGKIFYATGAAFYDNLDGLLFCLGLKG